MNRKMVRERLGGCLYKSREVDRLPARFFKPNGKIERGENMRTNQPTQTHLLGLGLAAATVVILGLVAVIINKPWLVIPALGIAVWISLAVYLKLNAFWARVLAFVVFGLGLFLLCLAPSLLVVRP
jgi:hypothetical protein